MRRFILIMLFFISAGALAGTCNQIDVGLYNTSNSAWLACNNQYPNGNCRSDHGSRDYFTWREVSGDGVFDGYHAVWGLCPIDYLPSQEQRVDTIYVYHFIDGSCPQGTVTDLDTGECGCISGRLNALTRLCEVDDSSETPAEPDNSDNTGGDDNPYGGDAPPSSECNFDPAGCLPWDTAESPPPVEDIPAPNNNDPPPPEAETTADSSSTDHTTGTTTSTTTQEWRESDGCTVKQTTTTTTNSDNSSSKDMSTTRTCPDGSSATTKTGWQTDSQGNTSLTGETISKEQKKEGTVSGGGTCDSAPACKGDAINCAIVMQQWLTRCDKNTEYSDSDCTSQPQCSGDVLMCASLINTWQDRCFMQRAGYDAQQEFVDRGFQTAEESPGSAWGDVIEEDISSAADGVFSARSSISASCPSPYTWSLPIGNFEFDYQPLCDAAGYIYWLVMLSAYIFAGQIIFKSVTDPI